ncbi:hypothetical protein ICL07_07900 [Chitinophaga qingshengii]|uniref:Lipoprotein n=1 Tax=Chitinophaga qingshengii TaxID=1569794 RepID=A0ABR7TLD2_9BACT|nr:hypothetical protein [Chitinophaga qingshengii]
MKKLLILFLLCLVGCTATHTYTISSPTGDRCLTMVTRSNFLSDTNYARLYLNAPIIDKNEYISIRWSDVAGFTVDWNSHPLKIRAYLLRENHIPDSLAEVKTALTEEERKEFDRRKGKWAVYDLIGIISGNYPACGK